MFENYYDHEHDFHHEPKRRMNPPFVGEVDTTQIGGIYDVQNAHGFPNFDGGYHIPTVPPLPPMFGAMTESEQLRVLGQHVNELCSTIAGYNKRVEDAFTSIVNSTLCNSAYYKEITVEDGYISESGSNYKVVHIPFLDRANQPIFFELGLAYDNTTNSGLAEECFDGSTRFIADKLIPSQNTGSSFTGTVIWKNAPIFTETGDAYTFAVTQNGFFKGYKNATTDVLKKDKIRNSCGARGILVYNKELAPNSFPSDSSTNKARIAVGQNYDTKERFIIIVDGGESVGCTSEQIANLFIKYGCMIAVELVSGNSVYGMDRGGMMFPPVVASEDDTPSIPESNAFWYITKRRHFHNEYVKDVAILTQKMGEEIWRRLILNEQTDYVKERVVELAKNLTQEIQDRKDADTTLDTKYTAEVERIDSELNRIETEYKDADVKLGERIDKEIQDRKDAVQAEETARIKAVNDETTARKKADDTEATTRYNDDVKEVKHVDDGNKRTYSIYRNDSTKIAENIEVYEYNKLVATLQTLYEVAKNLDAEVQARKDADDVLQAQITKEVNDRTNANTDLQNQITNEVTDRKSADTALETKLTELINDETKARTNADTALDNSLKALITAEQTARENGDTELANALNTLKTDYQNFKTTTNADLTSKQTQIDQLITDTTNVKTIITTLQNQMSSINETLTGLQTIVSTMETSLENMKQTINNALADIAKYEENIDATVSGLAEKIADLDNVYLKRDGDSTTGEYTFGSIILSNSKLSITGNVLDLHNTKDISSYLIGVATNSQIETSAVNIATLNNYALHKVGDTMTGNLAMSNCEITDVNSIDTHAVKVVTEGETSVIIDSTENTEGSGAILHLSDNNGTAPIIRGANTPTQDMDVVNLKYITDNLAWINDYKSLIKKLANES